MVYLTVHAPQEKIKAHLGHGTDGAVWATTRNAALKVFEREHGYRNERDCYLRLAEFGVTEMLEGFFIPEMRGCDDELMVVEMDLMQRTPYIIDFAKSRLDRPPDFPLETLRDFEASGKDLFGNNWPAVKSLLAALESFQIYYLDPKPHNIVFPP